jgi:CRP/FNR family cyclic AMP-dependent transcriptional regulator
MNHGLSMQGTQSPSTVTTSLKPETGTACGGFSADILRQTPLFGGMADDCRCVLTDRMEIRHYRAGTPVYTQGEAGRELFILVDGKADVVKHGQSLGGLRTADFFGEASFLDMQPRPHTVMAVEDLTVYAIPYPAMLSLYQANVRAFALIMMNLAREMSRRLRCADEMACRGRQGD